MPLPHRIPWLRIRWKSLQARHARRSAWMVVCVVAWLLLSGAAFVQGQLTEQDERVGLKTQVLQLVMEIDDPATTLARRRAAEQQLIELGPDVLVMLPAVFSPSAKIALERVRVELEKQAGLLALKGSRVTLPAGIPFTTALQQLSVATGNQWGAVPESTAKTSRAFDDDLYWRVLDGLLDDADWEIADFSRGDAKIPITQRTEGDRKRLDHALYHESFRIEVRRIEAVRDLKSPQRSHLAIRLQAAWEPRLHPIKLTLPTKDWSLRDDQDITYALQIKTDDLTIPVTANIPHVEFDLRFELPQANSETIAQLSGTIAGLIPAHPQTVTFSNLERLERQSTRIAEAVVSLDRTLADRTGHEFVVSVRFDQAADALESHHRWVFDNPLLAKTADGKLHRPVETRVESETRDGVAVRYRFAPEVALAETQLEYTTPTAIVPYEFPILFEGIQLP